MRRVVAALAILLTTSVLAFAANDEGRIADIDPETMTITLENGNSYRLPGEFDLDAIAEGMEVLLAYETVDGERQITDMDVTE